MGQLLTKLASAGLGEEVEVVEGDAAEWDEVVVTVVLTPVEVEVMVVTEELPVVVGVVVVVVLPEVVVELSVAVDETVGNSVA